MAANPASLPYHEPDVATLLILSSFLMLLNLIHFIVDRFFYCGLLGQILLGIAWGTPGGKWLSDHEQDFIVELGYLGLILLVYEGGLSTSFVSIKSSLSLSVCVALTGICLPIALSFILQPLAGASSLQAFSAGAALCSTSLGTTFVVLSSTGLTNTRLGVVLATAAMMDDVVGLVMVQVISSLGISHSIGAALIVRPVFVSLAFFSIFPLLCYLVVRPATLRVNDWRRAHPMSSVSFVLSKCQAVFIIHTAILFAMVTAAMYAGTSNLFAAYLAGAAISWWDAEVPHYDDAGNTMRDEDIHTQQADSNRAVSDTQLAEAPPAQLSAASNMSGIVIYKAYYAQVVDYILKPCFFASIGFSIPITLLFKWNVVWRGLVYSTLMATGKLACGIWLVRIQLSFELPKPLRWLRRFKAPSTMPPCSIGQDHATTSKSAKHSQAEDRNDGIAFQKLDALQASHHATTDEERFRHARRPKTQLAPSSQQHQSTPASAVRMTSQDPQRPISLYPAAILACAMVARGEIGFLVSAVARGEELLTSSLFLIVTWSIFLCTILSPAAVGLIVRRVKRLEKLAPDSRAEVLGVWGLGQPL